MPYSKVLICGIDTSSAQCCGFIFILCYTGTLLERVKQLHVNVKTRLKSYSEENRPLQLLGVMNWSTPSQDEHTIAV